MITRLLPAALATLCLAVLCLAASATTAVSEQKPVGGPAKSCHAPDRSQVAIHGGTFKMGSDAYYEEEGPVRSVTIAPFSIDRFAVTNAEFARFVAATHYVTDAERQPDPKDYPEVPPEKLKPGGAVFTPPGGVRNWDDALQWWSFIPGANWRHPDGPESTIAGLDDMPVVQVSYNDALAYAHWLGRALPTEEQFEFAARGGLDGKIYAWGDDFNPGGKAMANTWQGEFPNVNLVTDGFSGRAPVGCFPANGYGLFDMTGNVWQWTSSLFGREPADGMEMPEISSKIPAARVVRTIKGGSYLCAPNYCRRYRPAARQAQETSFSSLHLGFRTVTNQPEGRWPQHPRIRSDIGSSYPGSRLVTG